MQCTCSLLIISKFSKSIHEYEMAVKMMKIKVLAKELKNVPKDI